MLGDFTANYFEEYEFRKALELNKKFEAPYTPYISVRILNYLSEFAFEGLINQNSHSVEKPHWLTKYDSRLSGILKNYESKQEGAFTFDGIRFFRITGLAYQSEGAGLAIFTFRYFNTNTYLEKDTAFMIMPFRFDKLNNLYKQNIKDYLQHCDLGIRLYRSDDFTGTDVVADTILEQIRKAEFIICDITNCNKNVFFEVGFAKGINKDIIFLLEQNKPAEFFEVNHVRRIEYS